MSCEGKLGAACATIMSNGGSALAAAFGGDVAAATAVLEEVYRVARAQADAPPPPPASKLAELRARAADQAAEDATIALFTYLRDEHRIPPAELPAHGRGRGGVPLPRRSAQYGYQAVWETIQAVEQGQALPERAQQVWAARQVRRRSQAPVAGALPGVVQVSAAEQRAGYEHAVKLRSATRRRLQHLQIQRAHFGLHTDPAILIEIEDLEQEAARLDRQVEVYGREPALRPERAALLSPAQQREALLALARITGLPVEQIRLIDIVLGSVVLVLELPLPEAARLLALHHAQHPELSAAGFTAVAFERAVDAAGRPAAARFYQAVQRELASLQPGQPEAAPMPAEPPASVTLRVTLAE